MSTVIDFLTDPWQHVFMRRAFAVAVMCGVVSGVVGAHVVLRGMAFIGDAVSHSVFPGVAIAFVFHFNLVVGGAVAGLLTALAVAVFSQNRRLKEDTVIGVFFAAAFGLGIVILSTAPGYSGSLESFLFGQILGISDQDVTIVAVMGLVLLLVAAAVHKELVTVSLDRETARAAGLPVFALDIVLYALVTVTVVISLQAVGNILVLALLITPAACARLLTDRIGVMMTLAPAIGGLSAVTGLYLSYALNLAAGGLIVLVVTVVFIVCWLFAPRHGLLMGRIRRGKDGGSTERDAGSASRTEADATVPAGPAVVE
ncbi:anchored repeat-type ABC transporter permease subunit [Streptomyces sp. SID8361]|uniref:anchored repeat-type ABC transporter permease subunit n=1 Tax=Streptomyces TaxID=1883 RepID=UPI00081ED6D7|nr:MULTISPECIES: anchored repeat-type ABC transporter permease subunit [unclassified Streptomyces]AUA17074.1 Manganese transport system membrane protein MntB [Streptomyces sp. M56]MYU12444.1 anchored repeat-type ABC transporter permease subunit [Streptomyces sp. SID8361]MYX55506.1 anchored repeat-type ABC transporter permease subunit [Streptomyces sp. SID8382]SCF91637.1 manganese/iron transport system permease protein [Streptomyces sp. MnatMP-M27]